MLHAGTTHATFTVDVSVLSRSVQRVYFTRFVHLHARLVQKILTMAMASSKRSYKPVLIAFMSWKDNEDYAGYDFAPTELTDITAHHVVEWFNLKAYGTTTPSEFDRPIHARSHSLYHYKKALSHFMPNKIMQWDELTGRGNPTRSQALNDMTKLVKKFECRGQGAPSKARRALKEAEFRAMITQMRQAEDIETKYLLPALMSFQFHMIGRIDDCCKWKRENLGIHDVHDKAAKARLAWSKNVTDERAAPWQHVFGCMDHVFCSLLNLALWLEVFHSRHHDGRVRPMVFGLSEILHDAERAGDDTKAKVYNLLCPFFDSIGLDHTEENNKLGSHSIRKYASTWCRSNGISKDDKDHRGRWKSKRISDGYDDVQLDWIDARVAQVLCPGGVCAYEVVDQGCTNEWIATHVTPNVADVFGHALAVLLGKALLWLAFSPYCNLTPSDI